MLTTLLGRAKARLKSRAHLGALMILPLVAALPVHAGTVVLPTSGFTCEFVQPSNAPGGAPCAGGLGAVAQLGAGGLSFSISPGGTSLQGNPSSLLEGTFGQVATAIPSGTVIGYSYDFFLDEFGATTEGIGGTSTTSVGSDPNWAIELVIYDGAPLIASTGFISGTYGISNTEFDASGTMTTTQATNPNDVLTVEYILDLTGPLDGGNPFTGIQIPAGTSIDFDTINLPSPPTGTPEPASFGLLGAGLAWIGWKARQRRVTSRD